MNKSSKINTTKLGMNVSQGEGARWYDSTFGAHHLMKSELWLIGEHSREM